jgi:hypothetical protein
VTTEPTLDSILSGQAPTPAPETPQVDEPEQLVTDPVKNEIGTERVEGEAALDEAEQPKPDGKDGADPKVGAAFKAQREGQQKRYTEQVADFERKLEEREKAWEKRFETLVQTLAPRQQQQPQQAEVPDVFADPQGYTAHINQTVEQRLAQQRLDLDLRLTAATHKEDFPKAWEAFMGSVGTGQNAALYHQVMNSSSPGEAIVDWFKREQLVREVGSDPASFRERLRAEILAELQGQSPQAAPPTNGQAAMLPAVMPSNLADARNAGVRHGPAWAGPPPLKDIFHKG